MLKQLRNFWKEEEGMGVVEIALIIIVIVGVVVIFKEQLTKLVSDLMTKVTGKVNSIN